MLRHLRGVGGFGTANGSWGVFGMDLRYWAKDRVQTLFGAVYASVNLDYYGTGTPLGQLAAMQNPEARTIVITPYDKSALLAIEKAISTVFDLRPRAIIEELDLLRPIYAQTAAYGHFGRELPDFTWELTNRVAELQAAR